MRGRIFGILNTLLSVASFLPVIAGAGGGRRHQHLRPGSRHPGRDGRASGSVTLWAGIASWRRNARAGLHQHDQTHAEAIEAVDDGAGSRRSRPAGGRRTSRRTVGGADAGRPPMAIRLFAAAFLLASAVVAWVTITVPLAARALQLGIAAVDGLRRLAGLARQPRPASGDGRRAQRGGRADRARRRPSVRVARSCPARNEASVIDDTVRSLAALRYHRGGAPGLRGPRRRRRLDRRHRRCGARGRAERRPDQVRRREPGHGPGDEGRRAGLRHAVPVRRR